MEVGISFSFFFFFFNSHSDMMTKCGSLNVVVPAASLLDRVVPSAEICISCLSNQAKTARSQHINLNANKWKFIQITAVSIKFSEQI